MSFKPAHFHTVGQVYQQFKLIKLLPIPELQCTLLELVHEPTGASVVHLANDDAENLFCLSFKTVPTSSNGVAHILEHTVLCGSKKFPVKDPFFSMQRRSLNTFMNALTGADFTCYPAATQVPKDFYNLLEVYLDAVFYPNLNELSFLQEGHRLEFTVPDDPSSPLEFRGIVFNEMKGALASPSARLHEAMNAELFPNITYGINSGGDPKYIPTLTYRELRQFHEKYYHPSRCLFFFYGNLPLEEHLAFITSHVLDQAVRVPPLPRLPLQPRFTEPKRLVKSYPAATEGVEQNKANIAFGWLTCSILEQEELLALSVIESILMNTDASPLKMALLKSRLCKQALCYSDPEISEVPVVIELKGCNPDDADALEELLRKTLADIVRHGIPLNQIENAIHQLEFHRSEITGDHAPFGLSLFMRSALLKQHGGEAESGLTIHAHLQRLHERNVEDPGYFTGLIRKHFLDNPHFVRIAMVPDPDLSRIELEEEKARLLMIEQKLSEPGREEIVRKSAELAAFQRKQLEEDPDILPKVTLSDVGKSTRTYPLVQEKSGNLQVYHHSCFTNGIAYADLVFPLPRLSEDELPYVRLLTSLLAQMGCAGRSYAENLEYIEAHTGGVGASLSLNVQAKDQQMFLPSLFLRGKALNRKANKLFPLLLEMASSVDFTDKQRLREILLKQHTGLENALASSGMRYALSLSASNLDVPSKISYLWYGLPYFWKIRELALEFDQRADKLIEMLVSLQKKLFSATSADLVIGSDASLYDSLKSHQFYGLSEMKGGSYEPWVGDYALSKESGSKLSQGRIIPSPVAFIGKVIKTVPYVHPDAPALSIASFLLDNLVLHNKLREQGGAYGGGASCNATAGNFYFYSYRDPNVCSTVEAFELSIKTVLDGAFDEVDLEEAILERIQGLDAPIAPGSRAEAAYGWLQEGKTTEMRQQMRNKLLALTKEEVIATVQKHLAHRLQEATTAVFAGKELLERENQKFVQLGLPSLPIFSAFG
jgi:Zn-dependent M16 (insulinase) family peptidase